jgi:hypothetical protein
LTILQRLFAISCGPSLGDFFWELDSVRLNANGRPFHALVVTDLLQDWFICLPNALGLFLALAQLSLIAIYPAAPSPVVLRPFAINPEGYAGLTDAV